MVDYYAASMLDVLKNQEILVNEFKSGSMIGVADRFTLEIPYANIFIRLRVFMNIGSLAYPPDLIILWPAVEVCVEYGYLFHDWELSNPSALLIVVNRVKDSFNQYYTGIFNFLKDPSQDALFKSCRNLVNNDNLLEVYVEHTDSQLNTVNLFIIH